MPVRTPKKRRRIPIRSNSPVYFHSEQHPDLAKFVRASHELLAGEVQNRTSHEEGILAFFSQPFDPTNHKDSEVQVYLRSLVVCVLEAKNFQVKENAVQTLMKICKILKYREQVQAQDGFVAALCNLCYKAKDESHLTLLSYVTIDFKLNCSISNIRNFILHLTKTITSSEPAKDKDSQELFEDSSIEVVHGLRILANLVHRNLELKLVVTEFKEYDLLLKKLVRLIRHKHGCVDALQFLVFLVLNTDKEKEFFREKNLHSTLQIVFGKLSGKSQTTEVVKKCIVILTKLLNDSTDIMPSLESFAELEASLCRIIELSFRNDAKMRTLSLELLLVLLRSQQCQKILIHIFSSKPELSRKLLEDIFSSDSLDMQIICRRLLKKILQSRHSGLERSVKSEHQFALELLGNTEFVDCLVRSLCNQIHTTTQGINHSFGVAKTHKNQTAIRELVELIGVLCHRPEFRRKLAGSLQIEDVEALLSRDTLCKYTSLTFPLINLLFQIRKEMPPVNERFLQLVEDVHVLKQCGRCLSSKNQFEVREALLFLRHCFSHINEGKIKQLDTLDGIAKEIHSSNEELKEDREELTLRQNQVVASFQKYKGLYDKVKNQLNLAKGDSKTRLARLEKKHQEAQKEWAKEKEAMQKDYADLEKSNNDQINTLQNENQSLDEERKRLSDEMGRKHQDIRDQELTIKDLRKQIKQKTDKLDDIITEKKEDKNQRDKLQSQIRHLQSEKTQLAAEKQKVEDLVDEYKKKICVLARHYQKLQQDNTQVEEAKRKLERKLSTQINQTKKAEKEIKELKAAGSMKQAEIKTLKQKCDEQLREIKDLEEDCDDLEKSKEKLETTLQVMMEAAQKSKMGDGENGRRRKRRKRNQAET